MRTSTEQLLRARGVAVAPSAHSHYKQGWVHVCCPFCGDKGFHLGFPEGGGGGSCFKCGKHSFAALLHEILGVRWGEAQELAKTVQRHARTLPDTHLDVKPQSMPICTLPPGSRQFSAVLHKRHKLYLEERRLSPALVFEQAGCRCIAAEGAVPWSLVIPLADASGATVAWQTRDVSGRRTIGKYKTSPGAPLGSLLYGLHAIPPTERSCIVVEGVTDVWGAGWGLSVATFGIKWSAEHLEQLVRRFDFILVCYDNDKVAQKPAHALCQSVLALGKRAEQLDLRRCWKGRYKDPGEFTEEARQELHQYVFTRQLV